MKVHAVILAGGKGERAGFDTPKQFVDIAGEPLIVKTLRRFNNHGRIDSIIVASPEEYINKINDIFASCNISKALKAVQGGAARQESAFKALSSLDCADNDIVLIHDAARPFCDDELISRVIDAAAVAGAAEPVIPVTDTVARIDRNKNIESVLDRNSLVQCQTPQGFRFNIIMDAHKNAIAGGISAGDDITLVLENGGSAAAVDGNIKNMKVTSRLDFIIAEAIASDSENGVPL